MEKYSGQNLTRTQMMARGQTTEASFSMKELDAWDPAVAEYASLTSIPLARAL